MKKIVFPVPCSFLEFSIGTASHDGVSLFLRPFRDSVAYEMYIITEISRQAKFNANNFFVLVDLTGAFGYYVIR